MRVFLSLLVVSIVLPTQNLNATEISPEVKYIWKTLNGTNINPQWTTAQSLQESWKKNGPYAVAQMSITSPESSFATGVVRQLVTPLAGREINYNESPADFILSWMIAAIQNTPVDQLFTGEKIYSTSAETTYNSQVQSISQFLNVNVSDQSLKVALTNNQIFPLSQSYISDPNYRIGVLSTLQYGQSIFMGGTNRRPLKKITEDFLCQSIESIMNFQISDRWVGRDIPRNPGNDPQVYFNKCLGCHTGLDSLRGAFAGFDFVNDQLTWGSKVQPKMNNNPYSFQAGHIVANDNWQHLGWWTISPENINKKFKGPKPLVDMIVKSPEFYSCLVKRTKNVLCPEKSISAESLTDVANLFMNEKTIGSLFTHVTVDLCLKN